MMSSLVDLHESLDGVTIFAVAQKCFRSGAVALPVKDPLEFGTPLEDLGGLLDVGASDVLFPAVGEDGVLVVGGDSLLGAFLRDSDLLVPVGMADVFFHRRLLAGCTRASLAAARNCQDPTVFSLAVTDLVQLQLLVLTGAHAGCGEDDEGIAIKIFASLKFLFD
jgi:hypothetical protein